jgi:hypothetical protein
MGRRHPEGISRMTRPLWLALLAFGAALLLMAYMTAAHAEAYPMTVPLDMRPQPVKERRQLMPRCMKPRPTIIFLRLPDGRLLLMGIVERMVPC